MNPGYLSLVLICISLILLASGWKDVLLRGIPHKAILLFFICWFIGSFLSFTVFEEYQVNLSYLLLLIISLIILSSVRGILVQIHLLSIGLLLGSIYFALQEIFQLDPIMVVYRLNLDIAITLAVVALILVRNPLQQIGVLSFGLILGEFLFSYGNREFISFVLGTTAFQDKWWLTVVMTRSLAVSLQFTLHFGRNMIRLWHERRKGLRK